MGIKTEQAWDPAGFWDAVNEIRALAAELYYIDKAVDHVENVAPYPSPNEVYGGTDTIDVEIGWTAPFHLTIRQPSSLVSDGWIDSINEALQGFVSAGQSWATSAASGLSGRVGDITTPNAAVLTAAAESISNEVQDAIETTIPESLSASLQLTAGSFWGSAAEGFYTQFVTPFGEARENQKFLANGIAVICAASAGIVRQSQHSLMNAVCTTRDTLKSQLELRRSQHDGMAEVATILTIASTAATLLGLFELPKVGAKIVSIGSAMIGFAASGVEGGDEITITEKSAEGIQRGLDDAIGQIIERTWTHWEALQIDRVDVLAGTVAEMPSSKPLWPPRPDLADGAAPDEFYYVNSPQHTG